MTIISDIAQVQASTALAAGLILSFSAVAAAIGASLLGGKFLESAARQPEVAPFLFSKMIVVAGLVDVIPIIGVGLTLYFTVTAPFVTPLLQQIAA